MHLNRTTFHNLADYFDDAGLLPGDARRHLEEMTRQQFIFREQLNMADSIHLHIKVAAVEKMPHDSIEQEGGRPQNRGKGYIKYAFPHGLHFIFSSIPVSEEEQLGIAPVSYPRLDHIGIDIRDVGEEAIACFRKIPGLATSKGWPFRKQGGAGKKVSCCHVQVNEKYWVYPCEGVYWEFASGKLLTGSDMFGCDLRPANPGLKLPAREAEDGKRSDACCGTAQDHAIFIADNRVAAMRYRIKNSQGEILEDRLNGPAVHYLHGAGNILPLLESRLAGLKTGETKTVLLSEEEAPGTGDDFYFEVIIDAIRAATAEELRRGKPAENLADDCGPECCC